DNHYTELRNLIGRKYKLSADSVILGNGSDEIFDFIFKVIVKPKDKVLTFYPSYSLYKILMEIFDVTPEYIHLRQNCQYDIKTILPALTTDIKLMIIANPNNPTGTYLKHQDMEKLIQTLPRQTVLIVDEAYYHYTTSRNFPVMLSLQKKYPDKNIIIIRTFSKIYSMAGLRLGLGLAKPQFIKILNKIRPPFNVNSIAEKAAIYTLQNDTLIRKIRSHNNINKKFFYCELDKISIPYIPSEANFIFMRLPISAKIVFQALLKKGIIIRIFDMPAFSHYIRVTIGTKEEIKQFLQNLKIILKKY
ncbi:MAG: histidinol-phosphate transaminase, partial [bacterium]|nr:histidinol-phosphate transaminase [bacterium]